MNTQTDVLLALGRKDSDVARCLEAYVYGKLVRGKSPRDCAAKLDLVEHCLVAQRFPDWSVELAKVRRAFALPTTDDSLPSTRVSLESDTTRINKVDR